MKADAGVNKIKIGVCAYDEPCDSKTCTMCLYLTKTNTQGKEG